MKKIILPIIILLVANMTAQGPPIFNPTMTIAGYGIIDSPIGEEVDKAIDGDINTKFLDFELADGMGFIVDLGGITAAAHFIEITTANDFPVRDPIDFEIEGSIDGTNFSSVDTGSIVCIMERFEPRLFSITNATAYSYYRVNFSAPCDPSGGTGFPSIQVAEVQLYEIELAVDDNQLTSSDFKVVPNPNQGLFTFNYSGNQQIEELNIINMTGQVIYRSRNDSLNDMSFDLRKEASGIYFIQVRAKNSTVTKKIIIQ